MQDLSECVSPVLIVPRKDCSKTRLCADITQTNKAIKRVFRVISTIGKLRYDL